MNLPSLKVERLDDEFLDPSVQQALDKGLGLVDPDQRRERNAGVNPPAACTSAMARSRWAFDGQNGSNVRRTSSSSVVTVMFTCTRPPVFVT